MKLMTWTPKIGDVVTIDTRALSLSAPVPNGVDRERQYIVIGRAKGTAEFWLQDAETGELPTTIRSVSRVKGKTTPETAGFTPRELIKQDKANIELTI